MISNAFDYQTTANTVQTYKAKEQKVLIIVLKEKYDIYI